MWQLHGSLNGVGFGDSFFVVSTMDTKTNPHWPLLWGGEIHNREIERCPIFKAKHTPTHPLFNGLHFIH